MRAARHARCVCLCSALLILSISSAWAQYITFGKNKVNYRDFEWRVLRNDRFEFYFYPEEEELARYALSAAEEGYRQHREAFVHEVSKPIPVILYSSHHDFQQTNITPIHIPEGVAGLTESSRGRVMLPFDGSFHRFFHTLHHELVHAFQLSMGERLARERTRRRVASYPLWFTEGMAEHWSGQWDADGDLILRDLVIAGKLPEIEDFWRYNGTFTLYKLGQSVVDYISDTYGDDKLAAFYTDIWKVGRFEDLFPLVLGATQDEVSERWMHHQRERYYPDVMSGDPILHEARVVSKWGMEMKPTPIPTGVEGLENSFIFVSTRSGYASIYTGSLIEPRAKAEVVIRGQRSPEYLSFHAFRSRMDVSPRGWLVFSTQRGDRDFLVIYDLVAGEVVQSFGFAELVGATSPQWDTSGERIVFSGLRRSGQADLYVLDIASGRSERLTDDWFYDSEPAFHPGGERIVFVSDRGGAGKDGALNLFELDLGTGEVRRLTAGDWWDLSPSWSPDGAEVLFVSTRDGMRNLYTLDEQGTCRRRTRALEAMQDPRWLPSGREVLASVYHGERMHAAVITLGEGEVISSPTAAPGRLEPWTWQAEIDSIEAEEGRYRSSFALDVAQAGVAVDRGLGTNEGVQLLLRDLMGNRLMLFQLGNTTISTENFIDNFSASATYIDLSRRLNRGVSIFHHAGTYYDALRVPFFERRAGSQLLLSYPFSRFSRVETTFGLAFSEKEKPAAGFVRKGVLATHSISWIHDTSLWLHTGPIDGERKHVTLGMAMNLRRPGVEFVYLLADARRYLRLGHHSAMAFRLQGRLSDGPDPQIFLLGGTHSLRGYPRRALHGSGTVLANVELRFPMFRGFLLVPEGLGAIGLPGVQGALFLDAGRAWDDGRSDGWRGSYGLGFRMGLGGVLVLRLDFARRTDFDRWPNRDYTEFYLGWNY